MAVIGTLVSCQEKKEEPRPNFIFFLTDDISYSDIGCYGNDFVQTPNIDQMAAEGLLFENAYLTTSSCSPTRCSIITGRYPHNTGAPELHTNLPDNQVMFPELLREAGYYTVLSGKNHMGGAVKRAFDTITSGGGPGHEEHWVPLLQSRPKDQPFFCWFASVDAHRDWQFDSTSVTYDPDSIEVPPMLYDGPETRRDLADFYHEVTRTDYYLGELRKELESQGIADHTYIIYCGDNGRPFPRCKVRLYNSGTKTPFVVCGPGVSKGRTRSLISVIDIAPTFLELAGVKQHRRIQGVSFRKILEDPEASTRDYAFAEHNWHVYQGHERMVRYGYWMYIRNWFPERRVMCVESAPVFPAGKELWQAYEEDKTTPEQEDVFKVPRPEEELYHVTEDPHQFNNLAGQEAYADTLYFLRQVMDQWVGETGDHVPDPITPDRETLDRVRYKDWKRGQMAGARLGADTISMTGPVVIEDVVVSEAK